MIKKRIFVDGEYGTTGLQIFSRLQKRNDIDLFSIPHKKRHNQNIRKIFLQKSDFSILCLPDYASREAAKIVAGCKTRLIDTSTAHRTDPNWIFGFPELEEGQEERIASARYVSNPGCYSTGAIALIRPLTQAGILSKNALITISAISGYTGGGKKLISRMENKSHDKAITAPYFIYETQLKHKHIAEITQFSLLKNAPLFSPSVGRFEQGMIVQVPLHRALLKKKWIVS